MAGGFAAKCSSDGVLRGTAADCARTPRHPTGTPVTPSPTSSTTPATRWPGMYGHSTGMTCCIAPLRTFQSNRIDPDAPDRDADLPGPGVRLLDVGDVQDVGIPVLAELDGLHLTPPSGSESRFPAQ